ncbi:thiolase family protein [Xanthobacter autotrophicus]|uniref:thiolase family protein n=1 Tax=Xanthobacter autotrophicus TaxID=280 RepID=UPI00372CF253
MPDGPKGGPSRRRRAPPKLIDPDEHWRSAAPERLAKQKGMVLPDGTVAAGKASGLNDDSSALLLASEAAAATTGYPLGPGSLQW